MDDGREIPTKAPAQWQDDLYDLLRRHDVTQFAYVPDAGHRVLIARARRAAGPRLVDTRAVMIEGRAARPSNLVEVR
jgi:hypothetical protein